MIFLDNNSTTKTDPRVLEKMMPYFIDKFGNSSTSSHKYGWEASDAIENSREKISKMIEVGKNQLNQDNLNDKTRYVVSHKIDCLSRINL